MGPHRVAQIKIEGLLTAVQPAHGPMGVARRYSRLRESFWAMMSWRSRLALST